MTKSPETVVTESSIDTASVTGKVSSTNEGTSGISCDSWTGNQTDQTSPFLDAASQINSRGSQEGDRDASRIRETESLGSWARANACLIDPKEIDELPLVSNSTSEHEVHYRQSDSRAVKRTWPGVYDQSMVLFEPPGQPSFVISQEWFEGGKAPTMDEIAERLVADGFFSAPHSYFGWYRLLDGVVIVDAKPDNFVKTPAGVVPIDLQMAVFTEEQLKEAGLADPKPLVQNLNSLS